jgi:hypothetical protein
MKRIIACALLLPAVATAQDANEISYDYFDFSYTRMDWDAGSTEIDGTGWGGRLSVGIRENVFVNAEYRDWNADGASGGSTFKKLGFGVHGEVGDAWSLFGEVGFKSQDIDIGGGNVEDDPGYIAGGARWAVADGFELRFIADFYEKGKGTPAGVGESSVTFGGDIYMTDAVTLMFEVNENDDNTTSFLIGMRFYHKKDSSNLRRSR